MWVLSMLFRRWCGGRSRRGGGEDDEDAHARTVRTLLALTSFETVDTLAEADQDLLDVVPEIVSLAEAVLEKTPRP